MCPDNERTHGYQVTEFLRDETPARYIDVKSWPKRDCIRLPIKYIEWFDWSELFASGIENKLLFIAKGFASGDICVSGILSDASSEFSKIIKIIKIDSNRLKEVYFDAIWDDQSMLQSAALAAAARMVLIWDESQNWIILNDRYYEIGLFVVFDSLDCKMTRNVFHRLDEQTLLDRFSKILAINKVATLSELERWCKSG